MRTYPPIGGMRTVADFKAHAAGLHLNIPCDSDLEVGPNSTLAQSINFSGKKIGNRFCIHPMEGWDGTVDGKPSEPTLRRWRNFGLSGAKLIWGGEAVAVRHDGRANPNQLLMSESNKSGIAELREVLLTAHREACGNTDDLLLGLQLTHSGRFSRPNEKTRPEPRLLYRHPLLDHRVDANGNSPLLTDDDIRQIIDDFITAARIANELGFDFIDVKHCHGYLGHEFLSAHTRAGDYGGSFENRTRFLREVTQGVRSIAPNMPIGVRLSAFDLIAFHSDSTKATNGKTGPGIPERTVLPYDWGFGVDTHDPERYD